MNDIRRLLVNHITLQNLFIKFINPRNLTKYPRLLGPSGTNTVLGTGNKLGKF